MSFYIEASSGCKKCENFNEKEITKITNLILEYFPKFKGYEYLMFFYHLPNLYQNWPKERGIATFFPLDTPNSGITEKCPEIIVQNKKKVDFEFLFTRLVTEGNELEKTYYMSHEFQHAYQYINNKQLYYYGCILNYYLADKEIEIERLPLEYDATKESKYVTTSLYGEENVIQFIEKNLADKDQMKWPWVILNSIKPDKEYDWEKEIQRLWKKYDLEIKIKELKTKKSMNKSQIKIIEMYDFANS